jgi:hypothetical protein
VPSKKVTSFCDEAPEAQIYRGRVLLSAILMIERTLEVRFFSRDKDSPSCLVSSSGAGADVAAAGWPYERAALITSYRSQ